jgi:hypothetical protein
MTAWLTVLLLLIICGWYEILRTRELVVRHCQQLCRAEGLQFLDQSVAVVSIGIARNRDGRLELHRSYQFEYSETGIERHPAYVDLINHRITGVRLVGRDGVMICDHLMGPE